MIGLALSGGGSRAIAFHLGCLRALNDLGILQRLHVLSTVSGGSVIGAYYTYTPTKSFEEFETDIRSLLRRGLQGPILAELVKPRNLFPCIGSFALSNLVEFGRYVGIDLETVRRYPSRTDIFEMVLHHQIYPDLTMNSPRRNDLNIIIGACELRTGSAFRFGIGSSGSWRLGRTIENFNLSFAVAASASYPIFLPALDRTFTFELNGNQQKHRILLTDGGVYDNLGLQVLEPGRDASVRMHNFPCEYIIACNAGHGQQSGEDIPLTFFPRVTKSFATIHRRVQDSTMHHLHSLRETGTIKGFVLPYLGQIDERLPWKCPGFISRQEVINYPTNFSPMGEEWINKLSNRGEQLTRILTSFYLPSLIGGSYQGDGVLQCI